MDRPAQAEGLEQAFRGIVWLKARTAALACLVDLATIVDALPSAFWYVQLDPSESRYSRKSRLAQRTFHGEIIVNFARETTCAVCDLLQVACNRAIGDKYHVGRRRD